jgi:hypothetical protein
MRPHIWGVNGQFVVLLDALENAITVMEFPKASVLGFKGTAHASTRTWGKENAKGSSKAAKTAWVTSTMPTW